MLRTQHRVAFFVSVTSLVMLLANPSLAQEQWQPNKPIRMVLGYTPGGAADSVARDISGLMSATLGQQVIVEYKPGAAGLIAAESVANSAPDGYTIALIDGGPLTITPHARKLSFDPLTAFTPIGVVARLPLVLLVHPSLPVKDLPELIALLRKEPGGHAYSTSGLGSIHQLSAEMLKARTKTFMVHIPYRGASPALTDLMAGQVKISFATIAPAVPLVQSGKVRAIAVTSTRSVPLLPGVKTIAEQGVAGFDAQGWFILAGPKTMPAPIVTRLNQALNAALLNPTVRDKMQAQGSDFVPAGPEAASALINSDFKKWGQVIRDQNLKIE